MCVSVCVVIVFCVGLGRELALAFVLGVVVLLACVCVCAFVGARVCACVGFGSGFGFRGAGAILVSCVGRKRFSCLVSTGKRCWFPKYQESSFVIVSRSTPERLYSLGGRKGVLEIIDFP